ncbi:S41 family peptidase [Gemmatimonas phototrophica]|uniref:Tricorn protease homolog n=1 Tax=Gemmatimonas phototrophica TaxID=1379270 RepID=A0A143BLN2_9BACT|nr:S41 family peptidase [Gemmatimonas phototrophica]AMW05918.1 peptidase S41 [Gemmatimonas phototrophica]
MRLFPALLATALAAPCLATPLAGAQPPVATPALAEPSLSPDAREIALVSGGDIWTVPATGGDARLLVAHPANESRPLYSPSGTMLAFVSTRTGNGDVYLLDLQRGTLRRLTFDDAAESVSGWSRDGQWLYFHSSAGDISGMQDVYRVSVAGGTPMAVAGDRYASEFFAAPSPDGATVALSARGTASSQWWRHGRSHLDEAELWLVTPGAAPTYTRLSDDGGSKDLWPMWSPDGRTVFYMSDRTGPENLWSRPIAGGAGVRLTDFKNGRVLWPQMAANGAAIVFERDFGVWHFDVRSGKAQPVPITLRGVSATRGVERQTIAQGFTADVSSDGKKLALIGRGELWATDAREGGDAIRLTQSAALEKQPRWLRGDRTGDRSVVYVAWSADGGRIMLHDVVANSTRALTTSGDATQPTPSRDGKRIAYLRDGTALHVMNADGSDDRRLATGLFGRAPFDGGKTMAWSPDGQWVAYLSRGSRGFTNAYVVPVAGGEARPVSFLGSSNSGGLEWSPDGSSLLFLTSQRTESARLIRVNLVPRSPRFREDRFRDLFTTPVRDSAREPVRRDTTRAAARPDSASARPASGAPTRIVFEGIRERAEVLSPGIEIGSATLTPDGRTLVLTSAGGGQPNLYTWSLDELAREPAVPRQITTSAGGKSVIGVSADSREVWYTDGGRIAIVPVAGGPSRPVAVTASLDADFQQDKMVAFEQAWATQRDQFYDPAMHGTDWNAVRSRFAPVIQAAKTPDEFRRLLSLMVGELNASHSGASGPSGMPSAPVGKLGLRFDREAYERDGTLRVQEVVRLSPAAIAGVAVNDRLLAVNGHAVARGDNLDSLLTNAVERKVELQVSGPSGTRTVVVRPVAGNALKQLLYLQWVEERRAYVARVSNGRLGYVHMFDMGEESLNKLYLDLDAENFGREGVVIDMRNNNGGFVNAYALDVFARKPYMTMTTRGSVSVPARTQLGQRSLEKPTVLVTNQHTLSDGEDFTQGYRTLGLGKVVGEPTAGWIIYTSNVTLVDGTSLRLPFIRVDDHEGKNMELVPRPVDVPVTRPVGEAYRGVDSQLDTAVRVLLQQLGSAR